MTFATRLVETTSPREGSSHDVKKSVRILRCTIKHILPYRLNILSCCNQHRMVGFSVKTSSQIVSSHSSGIEPVSRNRLLVLPLHYDYMSTDLHR